MGTNAQQFCLKWNNHQANMLSVFDRLLSNKSLVDVTIGCEGRQVKAHKVVLSACSPFFENLFTENPCKHPIVILKDIRYADLKALVEFMYKGEVNVVQEQLPTLLKTAEALKIKGLAEVTGEGKSEDKPHASVTPRPESPGSRRKRQRVRRKSTDSVGGHSDSEESVPKASRTEHDDSSMDGATSLDDGSQASLQHSQTPSQASGQAREKEPSNVQSNAVTVNNSSSSAPANNGNSTTNGPNSSSKDADFEPTRLLEASMTTDHGTDNPTDLNNSTGPDNPLIPDGLDIKPIITLEEGATPTGAIVPASAAPSLPTGTDAISSLFPQGTGATALPGTSYQASPQSHDASSVFVWKSDESIIAPSYEGNLTLEEADTIFVDESGKSEDQNISRPHKCPICNRRFRYPWNIKSHLKTHSNERPFPCPECSYSATTKGNLRSHMSAQHRNVYPKWVAENYKKRQVIKECPICKKQIKGLGRFTTHCRSHTNERPYACDECPYRATIKDNLEKHYRGRHGRELKLGRRSLSKYRKSWVQPERTEISAPSAAVTSESSQDHCSLQPCLTRMVRVKQEVPEVLDEVDFK